jgi:DNA-binding MarR family transcriptional regulator
MVTRAVTQLYDDVLRPSRLRVTQFSILAALAHLGEANLRQLEARLALDQTTLTRSVNLLERDGLIERVPHPDARIKAIRPTARGRRALNVARPLWARAQDTVLGELGTRTWGDAQRRLARLRDVAVASRSRRPSPPGRARPGRRRRSG